MGETNDLLRALPTQLAAELARVVDAAMTLPKGDSSPVASATSATGQVQQGEKKFRARVVDAAMTPRDYVNQFLDERPVLERRAGTPELGYRDLAVLISEHFGMDFDHTTVYRAVKKRRK